LGPRIFFSPHFLSLSSICFSLYTKEKLIAAARRHQQQEDISKTHSKKTFQIKTYQAQPTRTRQDQKKKETH
jgi:hypothetical protein